MSKTPPNDATVAYYDQHAEAFYERTFNLDMSHLYEPFLKRLLPGARILDAGCGSGRDMRAFAKRGFDVVGMDASQEMVKLAQAMTGRDVHHLRFQDVAWERIFDGIWACASLLHVPRFELEDVFNRLGRALSPSGVCYMSFKHGEEDWEYQGRRFNNQTEASLEKVLQGVPSLEIVEVWRTQNVQQSKPNECWLNAVLRKSSHANT